MKTVRIEMALRTKTNENNVEAVVRSMAELQSMVEHFKKIDSREKLGNHVSRINGYAHALVNMDVISEKDANGTIRQATCMAAAFRDSELEELKKERRK